MCGIPNTTPKCELDLLAIISLAVSLEVIQNPSHCMPVSQKWISSLFKQGEAWIVKMLYALERNKKWIKYFHCLLLQPIHSSVSNTCSCVHFVERQEPELRTEKVIFSQKKSIELKLDKNVLFLLLLFPHWRWNILRCILMKQCVKVWTGFIWLRIRSSSGTLVNTVMNLQVP
jgi:hypothetical protein